MTQRSADIVICGAGIAGISVAWQLAVKHGMKNVVLVDAWPPPEIVTQDRPFPLSSITWQVNLLSVLPEQGVSPQAWWFYDSKSAWSDNGYSDSRAMLWGPEGQPVASSCQLVAEFSAECSQ